MSMGVTLLGRFLGAALMSRIAPAKLLTAFAAINVLLCGFGAFAGGHAGLAADVPYTLGLVDLDEGPRVLARLDPEAGAIGARVRAATFAAGAFNLLRFDPVEGAR